jgi:hypothetical protein
MNGKKRETIKFYDKIKPGINAHAKWYDVNGRAVARQADVNLIGSLAHSRRKPPAGS